MGKLTCGCLNVKIHVKSTTLHPVNTAQQLGIDPSTKEEFFGLSLSEVDLNLEGIKVEHPNLLRKRECCGWVIYECVNCELLTYAVNAARGTSKVLVNTSVKSEAAIIDRLTQSSDYSKLYKVILRSQVDNQPIPSLGVQSGKYESLQSVLDGIQHQLNQFLKEEEQNMEKKIRQYEETQRTSYAELQSKARRDKNSLINLVLLAEQTNMSTTPPTSPMSPKPAPTKTTNNQNNNTDSFMKAKTSSGSASIVKPTAAKPDGFGKKNINMNKQRHPAAARPRVPSDVDTDGVFEYDPGFDQDADLPFYESDDDTDESSLTDDSEAGHTNHALFSTSVPISVPMWKRMKKPSFDEDDQEEVEQVPGMENMAASMKALARSVHCDGTEMFGGVPRPRIMGKDPNKA